MVAMRVWVKCINSKAKITVPHMATLVLPNNCLIRIYRGISISTPKKVPMNR